MAADLDPPETRPPGTPCAVLSLVTRMNIGGPARQVLLLHEHLPGHLPALLAAGTPPPEEGELASPGVPVEHLPLVRPVRPAEDLRALRAVHRLVGERRPAILHTHMAKAGALGRLAAFGSRPGRRPRLVHTFHGHVLEGYFSRPQQEAFLRAERFLARRTDVLVAVSSEVRDELLALGVGRPGQYEVIPLGLDLAPYRAIEEARSGAGALRGALGMGPGVPLAGVLGRLVPVKDHRTLLAAVAAVPGLHLAVLGDGELRSALEAATGELGLAGRVHFAGWWADVPGALADLDVVVLPSRNEGTPVALIEALAAARPVVATAVGGVPAVVQHGETGLLCPPGDPDALAGLLRRTLEDPAGSRRRAAEGRARVAARFGHERMVADHVALYEELLRAPVRSGGPRGASGRVGRGT